MPRIEFAGKTIEYLEGSNLRMVLLHARLAYQCSVLGDLEITRHEGLWGQHAGAEPQ